MAKHKRTPMRCSARAWLLASDSDIHPAEAIIAGAAIIVLVLAAFAALSALHLAGAW